MFPSHDPRGLRIVVEADSYKEFKTPSGTRVLPVKGKIAEFEEGIFKTTDPEIIEYLTDVYKDRRYPVVRQDAETASAGSKPAKPRQVHGNA